MELADLRDAIVTLPRTGTHSDLQQIIYHVEALDAAKNGAYKERDMLLSLLTKALNCVCWLERHPDSDTTWENDWRWIVFITLPTGQASWHIHDSELEWFNHLPRRVWQAGGDKPSWDGHTTEEKYQRVLAVDPADVEHDSR